VTVLRDTVMPVGNLPDLGRLSEGSGPKQNILNANRTAAGLGSAADIAKAKRKEVAVVIGTQDTSMVGFN
jgi:hypothetical protein